MSEQSGSWQPDPFGRHEYRYWDGSNWTDQVSDGGVTSSDPATPSPAQPAPSAAPPVTSTMPAAAAPAAAKSSNGPALIIGIVALVAVLGAGAWFLFLKGDDGGSDDLIAAMVDEGVPRDQAECFAAEIDDSFSSSEITKMLEDDDFEPTTAQAIAFAEAVEKCGLFGVGMDDTTEDTADDGDDDADDDADDDDADDDDADDGDDSADGSTLPPALLNAMAAEIAASSDLTDDQARCFVTELFSEFGDELWEDLLENPDALTGNSAFATALFEIADTCGFDPMAFDTGTDGGDDDMGGFEEGFDYGDNPTLDDLWDACDGGDMGACDELFMISEVGSEYERFGDTCGGRQEEGTGQFCDQ